MESVTVKESNSTCRAQFANSDIAQLLATMLDTVCVSVANSAASARVADTLKRQAANALEVGESLTPQDAADVKRRAAADAGYEVTFQRVKTTAGDHARAATLRGVIRTCGAGRSGSRRRRFGVWGLGFREKSYKPLMEHE